MPLDIIIVGAGIGGLTAALALRRCGHRVVMLEKAVDKTEDGYALSSTPNASKILRRLGLDLEKAGFTPWVGIDGFVGDVDPTTPAWRSLWVPPPGTVEDRYGAPSGFIHRADLHRALWNLAISTEGTGVPVKIIEGVKVASFDATTASVTTIAGQVHTADLVIAADGVRSTAHAEVVGEVRPAETPKAASIRFVFASKNLKDHPACMNMARDSPWRMSYYFGEDKSVGLFRSACRNDEIQNFGVYVYRQVDDTKTWTNPEIRQLALECLKSYKEPIPQLIRAAPENSFYLRKTAHRKPLPRFHKNRLILLGDACHPMMPSYGQGAASAMEDAAVLGVVLRNVDQREQIESRLEIWENLRKPRASAMVYLSRRDSTAFEVSTELQAAVRGVLPPDQLPELSPPAIVDWMWAYDCIDVAEQAMQERGEDF
ncbi:FAD/NAD(P)-binding domain-containing protein [Periconia macrospinosa]|uniref:FAD/NAD(P)-binding domain-containing protein n=1 Tax=Periconia macrospinosa TaxID=97972 RepID=A0A2V1DUU0_9PLEO|nr:FAD/NAD(P)-binding domain-containing protein [Periconia macrospinosa]